MEMTIESELANLLIDHGGSLSASVIKERYQWKYEKPLPVSGKLTTWLKSFQSLHVHYDINPWSNDWIVLFLDVETIESELVNLLIDHGGSLSASVIKERYQWKYKKPLPVSGKLTTWLKSFQSLHVHYDTNPRSNDWIVRLVEDGLVPLNHHTVSKPTNDIPSTPAKKNDDGLLEFSYEDNDNAKEKIPQLYDDQMPMNTQNFAHTIVDVSLEEWFVLDDEHIFE